MGILEGGRQMAFLALRFRMLPEQRKPRETVIELRFLPGAFIVTFFALYTLLPFVLVVFFMAGIARRF